MNDYIIAYCIVAAVITLLGFGIWMTGWSEVDEEERQVGARMLLLGWVWPLVLVWLFIRWVVTLVKDATR